MKSSWYESIAYFFNTLRFELSTALAVVLTAFALIHGYRVNEWDHCASGAFLGWGLTHGTGQERPYVMNNQRNFGVAEIAVFLVKNLQETLTTLLIVGAALLGVVLHWIPAELQDAAFGAGIAAGLTYGTGKRAMRILEERISRSSAIRVDTPNESVSYEYSEEETVRTSSPVNAGEERATEESYLDLETIRGAKRLEGTRDE